MPARRTPAGHRQALTTERIARAALEIVQESGYAAVSMRAVATRLDTGQASLYAHVHGKADLDRIMVESVMAEFATPSTGSWRDQLASQAAETGQIYARYPGLAVAAFASLPRTERYAEELEMRLQLLRSQGLELRQALAAHVAVGLLAAARAIEDAMIAERIVESGLTADEWWERAREMLGADTETRPLTVESSALLTAEDRAWMSTEIVELVLDGIQARYAVDTI